MQVGHSTNKRSIKAEDNLRNKVRGFISTVRKTEAKIVQDSKIVTYQLGARELFLGARRSYRHTGQFDALSWVQQQLLIQIPSNIVNALPRIEPLKSVVPAKALKLDQQILWITERVLLAKDTLRNFRVSADILQNFILRGLRAETFAHLDNMEKTFGTSYWLISTKLAAIQQFEGLEAQKKYAEEIKSLGGRSILSFMVHHLSARNEPNTSFHRFSETTARRISETSLSRDCKAFARYALISQWPKHEDDISDVLKVAENFSIIDIYECLIGVIQYCIINDVSDETIATVRLALSRLPEIKDWRIKKARLLTGAPGELDDLPFTNFENYELLLSGKIGAVIKNIRRDLRISPENISNHALLAVALAFRKESAIDCSNAPYLNIIQKISRVVEKAETFKKSAADLLKITRNFTTLPTLRGLDCLVENNDAIANLFLSDWQLKQLALNNPFFGLEDILIHANHKSEIWKQKLLTYTSIQGVASIVYNSESTIRQRFSNSNNVSTPLIAIIEAAHKFKHGKYSEALSSLNDAINDRFVPARTAAWLLSIKISALSGNIGEAIQRTATLGTAMPHVREILPLNEVFFTTYWEDLSPFSDNLALAVALDLFLKQQNSKTVSTLRRFAFDDFLIKNGILRPTQLKSKEKEFNQAQLIYFLKYICIIEVMDMNPEFVDSKDLQNERIDICKILLDLDPHSSGTYDSEIFILEHGQRVEDGIRVVNGSRVYVDIEAVKSWAKVELSEPYLRYIDLVKAGVGISENVDVVFKQVTSVGKSGGLLVPENDADDILVRMVEALREKFLFDSAIGLDSYISKRIRHGSLLHYLRSPVETHQLITQKTGATGKYKANLFWLGQIGDLENEERKKVISAFADFSSRFDSMALHLKDDLLHIRSSEQPDGMITLAPTADVYKIIRAVIQYDITDFESFLNVCFNSFWGILEHSFLNIRNYLENDIRSELTETFARLADSLRKFANDADGYAPALGAITLAKQETDRQLDSIINWFNQPNVSTHVKMYTFHDAVDVAVGIALQQLRNFKPNITNSVEENTHITGGNLPVLFEILWVIIQNAFDHSGLSSPSISISGGFDPTNSIFQLTCSSDVAPRIINRSTERRLETIREKLKNQDLEEVRRENKSGLLKIGSVTRQSDKGGLTFGFNNGNSFRVDITLSFILDEPIMPEPTPLSS